MSFASLDFLAFLAILFILYYVLPKKWQWPLLLIASYVFYYFAGIQYLAFILFTTITTYLVTIYMDGNLQKQNAYLKKHKAEMSREEKKQYKNAVKKKNRVWFIVCITVNFLILFFCKAVLLDPLNTVFSTGTISFLTLGLPLGMSFYMFQSMGYVIDVYRGKAEALHNPFKVALFVSFFPQLIQGPISKFEQLKDTMFSLHSFDRQQFAYGMQRMLWGYFKKMVVADRIAVAVTELRGSGHDGIQFLVLVTFYAIQEYGDFTGGIDIAIGIGQCLGIKMPENFLRPFFSKNITEYWKRWHISLSDWMKSYIFYPITVSQPMLKLSTKGRAKLGNFGKRLPIYIGSILTWVATGVWHGFNPHFVVWGLLNCFFIVLSEELAPLYEKFHNKTHLKGKKGYDIFEVVRMFTLMNFIRGTDLFDDIGEFFRRFATMFTHPDFSVLLNAFKWSDDITTHLGLGAKDYIIVILGIVIMTLVSLQEEYRGSVRDLLHRMPRIARYAILIALLICVIVFGYYGIGYNASDFIYGKF